MPAGFSCRRDALPTAALLLLGSLSFVHLTSLPAFEDEGSQLRWIWRLLEAGEWLQPLNDGKPLEAWPIAPLVALGLSPLWVMRALHVLAGMMGTLLIYRLDAPLGSRSTALAGGVLFAIRPFAVYLQRFALSDMFVCAAGVWVLLSVVQFLASPTAVRAAVLAMALVLAAFCKFPVGFVFLAALPAALLLMPSTERLRLLNGRC